MKKALVSALLIITLAFSSVTNVSAYECEFDEVTFEIPNYCIEEYVEEFDAIRWSDNKAGFVLTFNWYDNYDDELFSFMSMEEILEYYELNYCLLPEEHTSENIQTYNVERDSYGYLVDGTVTIDGAEEYFWTFFVATKAYHYVFEFTAPSEDFVDTVGEILDSIYVLDYETIMSSAATPSADETFFEAIGFVLLLIVAVFAIIFKVFGKYIKVSSKASDKHETTPKAEKVMPTATKFELNGKNINALNERFTVGKRDENFAQKELEKERKEREKMFD